MAEPTACVALLACCVLAGPFGLLRPLAAEPFTGRFCDARAPGSSTLAIHYHGKSKMDWLAIHGLNVDQPLYIVEYSAT